MAALECRLVEYVAGTDTVSKPMLAPQSWSASFPVDDIGSMSLSLPDADLSAPFDVAVEVWDGEGWVEPRNGRFGASQGRGDRAGLLSVPSLTMRGIGALLEDVQVVSNTAGVSGATFDSDGKRQFLSKTPAQIIQTLITESTAAGFSDAVEVSSSGSWGTVSVAYAPGADLLTILSDMASYGQIDFWMQGRVLHIVPAEATTEQFSDILLYKRASEAAVTTSWEGCYTDLRLEGADGKVWTRHLDGVSTPRGRRQQLIMNASVSVDETAAKILDAAEVKARQYPRVEYKHTYVPTSSTVAPFVDFAAGDKVRAANLGDELELMRVHQVTVDWTSGQPTKCTLTLNNRFVDVEVRDRKVSDGIVHGSGWAGGDYSTWTGGTWSSGTWSSGGYSVPDYSYGWSADYPGSNGYGGSLGRTDSPGGVSGPRVWTPAPSSYNFGRTTYEVDVMYRWCTVKDGKITAYVVSGKDYPKRITGDWYKYTGLRVDPPDAPEWVSGTAYPCGAVIQYGGALWCALKATTAKPELILGSQPPEDELFIELPRIYVRGTADTEMNAKVLWDPAESPPFSDIQSPATLPATRTWGGETFTVHPAFTRGGVQRQARFMSKATYFGDPITALKGTGFFPAEPAVQSLTGYEWPKLMAAAAFVRVADGIATIYGPVGNADWFDPSTWTQLYSRTIPKQVVRFYASQDGDTEYGTGGRYFVVTPTVDGVPVAGMWSPLGNVKYVPDRSDFSGLTETSEISSSLVPASGIACPTLYGTPTQAGDWAVTGVGSFRVDYSPGFVEHIDGTQSSADYYVLSSSSGAVIVGRMYGATNPPTLFSARPSQNYQRTL